MRYDYRAIDEGGQIHKGCLEASHLADLEARLLHLGLEMISGHPTTARRTLFRRRIPRMELVNFCFHLEQLLQAGVAVRDALMDLRDSIEDSTFRSAVAGLLEGIDSGFPISDAMEGHPDVFDPVFISLIRAGESSGRLPEILAARAESLKWEDEIAAATRRGLIYPGIVAAVALSATAFLMIYLVPQLKLFVQNMGQTLPLHARVLFLLSDQMANHWPWLISAALGIPFVVKLVLAHFARARYWLDRQKLKLPFIGNILCKIILARFAGTFALLYSAGIPVLDAIRRSQEFAGNLAILQALEEVERDINGGNTITEAFSATGLFPPLVVRMLRIGETTGGLDTALRNVSYFYGREVRESSAKAQTLIEPVLTVFMGVLLGWIMLSVIGQIYDVISRIKA